jgi:hypothetical protein
MIAYPSPTRSWAISASTSFAFDDVSEASAGRRGSLFAISRVIYRIGPQPSALAMLRPKRNWPIASAHQVGLPWVRRAAQVRDRRSSILIPKHRPILRHNRFLCDCGLLISVNRSQNKPMPMPKGHHLKGDWHGSGHLVSVFWLWPQVVCFPPSSFGENGPPASAATPMPPLSQSPRRRRIFFSGTRPPRRRDHFLDCQRRRCGEARRTC